MPFLQTAFKRMLPNDMKKHMDNNMQNMEFSDIKRFMKDWADRKRQEYREAHKPRGMDMSAVESSQWPSPVSYEGESGAGNLGSGYAPEGDWYFDQVQGGWIQAVGKLSLIHI